MKHSQRYSEQNGNINKQNLRKRKRKKTRTTFNFQPLRKTPRFSSNPVSQCSWDTYLYSHYFQNQKISYLWAASHCILHCWAMSGHYILALKFLDLRFRPLNPTKIHRKFQHTHLHLPWHIIFHSYFSSNFFIPDPISNIYSSITSFPLHSISFFLWLSTFLSYNIIFTSTPRYLNPYSTCSTCYFCCLIHSTYQPIHFCL